MKFDFFKNKKIYLLGIGGISMYAIALLLQDKGASVFGYDRSESDTTKTLEENGIKVFYSPNADNCKGADFCVCTAAIGAGNEEYDNVLKSGIPIIYRGEMLGRIIECFNNSIGVSGTHGKSTTSGMLSQIYLSVAGSDPTILMGAVLPSIESAYKIGNTTDLIFEACEYKDSFLSFRPKISVILNVKLDHTDYFENIDKMKDSFIKYASGSEMVVANMDCPDALDCAIRSGKKVISFSICDEKADYYLKNITASREKTSFDVYLKKNLLGKSDIFVPGEHNLSNALAAIAAAHTSGISFENIQKGIKTFKGIKRRLELLGKVNGAYVYDDYAHHPDEINATLSAALGMGFSKIICLFQPHTYTRLSYFFDEFVKCFNNDVKTIFLPAYAAREINTLGYDSEKLTEYVDNSTFIDSLETASKYIATNAKENEMYILMGAGDVTNISKYLKFDEK